MAETDFYDKVDNAIIYLSQDVWMDKWKIQKGIFYYLWLDSINQGYDFLEIIKKLGYEPYKQGPFSEFIDGEVEMLIKDDFLEVKDPESKILPVRASNAGKNEFLPDIKDDEKIFLKDIKFLLENLSSDEVIFFVYFNPHIPDELKEYFISKSEIKGLLKSRKDNSIKKLLKLEIIDQFDARKIEKSIDKMT